MIIGSVPYMNAKPLIYGFENNPEVELIFDVPSRLSDMLDKKEIAAGMVSSVSCFQNNRLEIIPSISISSIGPVESVKLFHKGDIRGIRSVALDTSSLTSVLLARIILLERYGLEPKFTDMPPALPEMLQKCVAAVLIGDPAMQSPKGQWHEVDLGEEWHTLTGLPFVFAVWAANPDMASGRLTEFLQKAKSQGLQALDAIAKSESERLSLPFETCFHYLSETMNYDLTEDHLKGLELFRAKAVEHGFLNVSLA